MNEWEKRLRLCGYGAAYRAVRILDSWDDEKRRLFREAYEGHDWPTVFRLCMLPGDSRPPEQIVLYHLMDATAPE